MKNVINVIKNRKFIFFIAASFVIFIALLLTLEGQPKDINPSPLPSAKSLPIERIEEVPPLSISGIHTLDNNKIVAISRQSGKLISLQKDEEKVIYDTPISNYSYTEQYVVAIDQTRFDKITVINTETNDRQTIMAPDYDQIIAASLAPDLDTLYFIGKYSPFTSNAKLYKTSIKSFSPQEIASVAALKIEALSDNRILVYSPADAPDKGKVLIFNSNTGQEILNIASNGVILSPSKSQFINFTSSKTSIFSESNSEKAIDKVSSDTAIAWINDKELVLVTNIKEKEIEISYIDINSLRYKVQGNFMVNSMSPLVRIEGISDRTAVARNTKGEVFSFELP